MVVSSISKAEVDLRSALYENIILAGGTTATKGFSQRLFNEVKAIAPTDTKIRMTAPQDRVFSAWIGGSYVASLPAFKTMCVSRKDYDDSGPNILHKRFF